MKLPMNIFFLVLLGVPFCSLVLAIFTDFFEIPVLFTSSVAFALWWTWFADRVNERDYYEMYLEQFANNSRKADEYIRYFRFVRKFKFLLFMVFLILAIYYLISFFVIK